MKFEHRVTVNAPRAKVDAVLADIPRVAMLVPGVETVTDAGEGAYEGGMRVKVGPMSFNFSGKVDVTLDEPAGRWTMKAQANDRRIAGGVTAVIDVQVTEPAPATTELHITSDVQLMGRLGGMGQPLIKRKVGDVIAEFAKNLQAAVS